MAHQYAFCVTSVKHTCQSSPVGIIVFDLYLKMAPRSGRLENEKEYHGLMLDKWYSNEVQTVLWGNCTATDMMGLRRRKCSIDEHPQKCLSSQKHNLNDSDS